MKVRNGFVSNSSSCSFVVKTNQEKSEENCPCCGKIEYLAPIEYIKKYISYVGVNRITHPTDFTPEQYDHLKTLVGKGSDCFLTQLVNNHNEELYQIEIYNGPEESKLREFLSRNPNIEIIGDYGP